MEGEGTGHDWWHIYRVWQTAKKIGREERANMFVVELSALLHDIADHKFHGGDDTAGPKVARGWMEKIEVDPKSVDHVCDIIANMSFNKTFDKHQIFSSAELRVVQDADRLDAIGAIGIARAFAYGGHKQRKLYDPAEKPMKYKSGEEYRKNNVGHTVNHFYEKLLLIKDRMNTKTGKRLARARHKFMERYLSKFFEEWKGER